MVEQWVITVVAEGDCNPFDITSDFLEALRVQGDYNIVSMAITPASGISGRGANDDNDDCTVCGKQHEHHIFSDIVNGVDGNDYASTYAGISVSDGIR